MPGLCQLCNQAQDNADDNSHHEPPRHGQAPPAPRAVPSGLFDELASPGSLKLLLMPGFAHLAHDLRMVSSGAWKVHNVTSIGTVRPGGRRRKASCRAIFLPPQLPEEVGVLLPKRRIGGEALRLAHQSVEVTCEGAVP